MLRTLTPKTRTASARTSQIDLEANALFGIERVAKAAGLLFFGQRLDAPIGTRSGTYVLARDSYLGRSEVATVVLEAARKRGSVRLDVRSPEGTTVRRIDLVAGLSRMQVFDAIEHALLSTYLTAAP